MVNLIIRLFTTVAPDFQVLWLASKDLFTANNPYINSYIFTGVGYPANTLLFYLPLTLFNSITAQNIFTLLSLVSIFISIYLIFKILNIKYNTFLFMTIILLTFISFPTKFTLGMGQNNFVALALLLFSFYLYRSKKVIYAGLLLGLSISLKTIFIYFLLFYFIKKQWKVVVFSLVAISLLILIVYLIRGNFNLYTYYLTEVLPPLFRFENREIYMNQGLSGFISRMFTDINTRKLLTSLISFILISYNIFVIYAKKNIDLVFSFTIITLLFIDSLAWQHHFVWLIFPLITLFNHSTNIKSKLLIALSFLLVSLNLPNSLLFTNSVFLGTLILYGMNIKYLK
jgi:hypothetical protein